ncbi:sulfatase family protein [Mangrovibrevibacter kandeliae]|uniref:sulfatase family protein n=1 Tax=Mangrovibrevibacter kandeliae TaxID=2968473 RepID=UPI002118B2D8|nr:sulfatase [Aurantimonas sp. CSK15Z-1]MCQ8783578.1 sulfatase [Aurantimonas sp. CSK15Z-1]
MNRREFLRTSAAGALATAALPTVGRADRRPNILYVFSDQHRAVSLPGEPHNEAQAPHLARFRSENLSMERCVSNYPLCTPYRGILMSGRWPQQTGLLHNNIALGTDEYSLGRAFRDAGYRTAYVGKWHLQGGHIDFIPPGPGRQGFDDWHVWVKTNAHYRSWTFDPVTGETIRPRGWNCTLMTDQAIGFLKRQRGADTPFFLALSWNPPHPPFNPPPRVAKRYRTGRLGTRPNVHLNAVAHPAGEEKALQSDAALQTAMAGYYGGITGVDVEFGRLLDALDATGLAEDTIVVYTSDHGEMLGSHGRMAKQVPFEESCRVPFFVRWPGRTVAGGAPQQLFATVDIYPTLCGLAGVPVPEHCVGRDHSAVMRGDSVAPSPHAFLMNQVGTLEGIEDDGLVDAIEGTGKRGKAGRRRPRRHSGHAAARQFMNEPTYRGVRTDTHTYAVAESGRWCLFDNRADPFQTNNLVGDPAQKPLMDELDKAISAWLTSAGDAFLYAEAIGKTSGFPT